MPDTNEARTLKPGVGLLVMGLTLSADTFCGSSSRDCRTSKGSDRDMSEAFRQAQMDGGYATAKSATNTTENRQ